MVFKFKGKSIQNKCEKRMFYRIIMEKNLQFMGA